MYLNTQSGLTGALDTVGAILAKNAESDAQLRGIAPALAATGVALPQQPQGILSGILSSLGIGGGQQQQPLPSPQAAQAVTPQGGQLLPSTAPQTSAYRGPAPGFDNAVTRTLGFEGGLNPKDTNGTPSMYGINGAAHPGVDVASLTPDAAKSIYRSQYWDAIGGDSLPPALSRAAFDTAVIAGPGKAKELLAASGGDPMKLMDLREKFQNGLVQSDPQKYGPYAKAWSGRNNGLRLDIAALNAAGGGMPAGASAYAPQGAMPGTTDAGADVAAAGLAAQSAAGYGSPTGVSTGAQTAAVTGAAPMPIASASQSATPTMQTGRAPGAAPAPALGAAAGVARAPLGGITNDALGAMIANPASRDLGLKLWQQKLGKGDFGFSVTPDGSVIRTDKDTGQAVLVYQAPVKQGFQELNGRLVATDPLSGTAHDATPAGLPQGYRPATADERKAFNVQGDAPLFIGPDGKPGTLNNGVNVSVNSVANPILEGAGKQFSDSAAAARSAADKIRTIQTARAQITPAMITGAFSGQRLAMQKVGALLGVTDPNAIQSTEAFKAAVKPMVLQAIKVLGTNPSDADRRFLEEGAGGNTELDAGSIGRILDSQEREARALIQRHDDLAGQMIKKQPALDAAAPMLTVQAPPEVAPPAPAPASPPTGGVVTVQTPEQARALPKGTRFRNSEGREFIR